MCMEFFEFFHEEFADMIAKAQWVVLPTETGKDLQGLCVSPPGVVPQLGQRPRWIVTYSWSLANNKKLDLARMKAMQFGHTLVILLREILLADPKFDPVELMKVDLSDSFYRVSLNIEDIPKIGVAFTTKPGKDKSITLSLVLPMG